MVPRTTREGRVSTVTKIEWTEVTWNPVTGCDRISPGCDHCYALTLARRLMAMGQAKYQHDGDPRTSGPGFGVTMHEDALEEPLRWRTPRMVFTASMGDIGHARVPRSFAARIWAVMALARRHTFQVLTKRPARLAAMTTDPAFAREVGHHATDLIGSRAWQHWQLDLGGQRLVGDSGRGDGWTTTPTRRSTLWSPPWPLPNVWLGTSIEADRYSHRAAGLRQASTALRFLSLEPLLDPLPSLDLSGIDWVILGGESGPRARDMDLDWLRELISRSRAAGTAVFVKQLGSCWCTAHGYRGKGNHPDRWPGDLRIREMPAPAGMDGSSLAEVRPR
jgi:protein gp37